jgi:hypothetical protein
MAIDSSGHLEKKLFDKDSIRGIENRINNLPEFLNFLGDCQASTTTNESWYRDKTHRNRAAEFSADGPVNSSN